MIVCVKKFRVCLQVLTGLSLAIALNAAPARHVISVEKGLIYGHAGAVELKMDLARPVEGAGPYPAIVWIHGGGWHMGDRAWGDGYIQMLAASSYVAVTISYRFAPEFKWPAQIEDAKAAVRYLRAHARELKVDPDHLGVMGESSGGHLALMVGLTDAKDGLEGDSGSPGVSSAVQAVVSYCTLTDFTKLETPDLSLATDAQKKDYAAKRQIVIDLAGTEDPKSPLWAQLSPVTYADKDDPPVLLFQGSADQVVPEVQAHLLDKVLTQVGVPHHLYVAPGGGHVWKGVFRVETDRQLLAFFARYLKSTPSL